MKSLVAWLWLFWFYLWALAAGYAKAFSYTEDAAAEFAVIVVFLLSTTALGIVILLWRLLARRFAKGAGRLTTVRTKPIWTVLAISAGVCGAWLYSESMYRQGLRFEWEFGTGASGDYAIIHSYRWVDGQMIPGPECDGLSPQVWFSDRDGDGKRDLVCYGDGFERAVFGLVEPYTKGQPAFRLIRGGEGINYPQAGIYGN